MLELHNILTAARHLSGGVDDLLSELFAELLVFDMLHIYCSVNHFIHVLKI